MIEKMKEKDSEEGAKVYNKGLEMEIPPGFLSLEKTLKILEKNNTYVYKEKGKIKGLVCFEIKPKMRINFICAIKQRKGIGTKLMLKVADFGLKNNVDVVYSNVSSQDKKAMKFYEKCGFKKYGKYYTDKSFLLYKIKAKPKWIKKSLSIR